MTIPTWLLRVSSVFISIGSPGSNSGPDWTLIFTIVGAIAALLGALLVVVTFILPLTPLYQKIFNWLHPVGSAFARALQTASEDFESHHPGWTKQYFDQEFFQDRKILVKRLESVKGSAIREKFLNPDLKDTPTPNELARCWADFMEDFKHKHSLKYFALIEKLEPAATEFLLYLAQAFKAELESRGPINDHKAKKLISKCERIYNELNKKQAIAQAHPKYLEWLIKRCQNPVAPDPSKQMLVELDYVYILPRVRRQTMLAREDKTDVDEYLERVAPNFTSRERKEREQQLLTSLASNLDASSRNQSEILDIAEVINSHNHLVILGDPGSGKSTLLQHLALKHAKALKEQREVDANLGPTHFFPILIHIADYAQHLTDCSQRGEAHKSLQEYLADLMHGCPQYGLKELLDKELTEGNCLILMDGYDEVVKDNAVKDSIRRTVAAQINNFVTSRSESSNLSKPPNRFIVTSRIYGYRNASLDGPFVEYTLEPMDDDQRHLFLERWYDAMGTSQRPAAERKKIQRKIQSLLDSEQNLERDRLIRNPLLLLLLGMTFVYSPEDHLATRRVELYKDVTKILATTRPHERKVPVSELIEEEYLTRLLSQLAYWLHTNKSNGKAREQEIRDLFHKEPANISAWWAHINPKTWGIELPEPEIKIAVKNFLDRVTWHTGLLVKGNQEKSDSSEKQEQEESYSFIYRPFQEYYTAHYLFNSSTQIDLIRQHLHDPLWDQPILLAVGLVGSEYSVEKSSELLERAILADVSNIPAYEKLLGRNYLFALRCLADHVPVNNKLMELLINQLRDELLKKESSCTERACFERYQQALQETLKSLRGSPAAVRLLKELVDALNNPDATIFSRAINALGNLRQPSPSVLKALKKVARTNKEAIWCLGELGDTSKEVRQALFGALEHGTDDIPKAAAEALGKLGRTSPEVVNKLLDLLNQGNSGVYSSARDALMHLQNPSLEVARILHDVLKSNDDPDTRSVLITVLSKSGQLSDEAVPALLKNLLNDLQNSTDADIRIAAAKSLGELRQSPLEVVTALRKALYDQNSGVAKEAVKSLGELRYPTTIANDKRKHIIEFISKEVTAFLGEQMKSLIPTELEGDFKALIEQMPHVDEENVRNQQEIHYPTALLLEEVLQVIDNLREERHREEVRKDVTGRLLAERLEKEEYLTALVIGNLIKLLKDPNGWLLVRQEVATTLGSLARAFPELALIYPILDTLCEAAKGALEGTRADPTIRTNAIISLSKLQDTSGKVVKGLIDALLKEEIKDVSGVTVTDPYTFVRARAAENLGQTSSKAEESARKDAISKLRQIVEKPEQEPGQKPEQGQP
jgi:HEAT repeat protein/DNA replication protein DnaC